MHKYLFAILFLAGCAQKTISPARGEMTRLLKEADTDRDNKITVLDKSAPFILKCNCGKDLEVQGTYFQSNLLQELTLASAQHRREIVIAKIFENPVDRITRSIRERYWNNLIRQVSPETLAQVLDDSKLPEQKERVLYIPEKDVYAQQIFKSAPADLNIKVVPLPDKVDSKYMRSIKDRHGLLYLPAPYVVPGGRFNEMYGWDSYFESLGLIQDGRVDLARAMADNFIYEIEHYGKILNGNRTYYLNRSQPPFLTSLIRAVDRVRSDREWKQKATAAAIKEYFEVWMNGDRLTSIGLNRYYGSDFGVPPEVEPGHFDEVLKPIARRHKLSIKNLVARYNEGKLEDPALRDILAHDRAVRESGHDTTYRWRVGAEDRAADFVTVDLNSLLYKYETDLAELTGDKEWLVRAEKREKLMMEYLWDAESKMFFDFNWRDKKRSTFVSATSFFPLWAKMVEPSLAKQIASALLAKLEAPGGILSDDEASVKRVQNSKTQRQWDYPNGWAPHQMLAWQGLKNYGMTSEMHRLIYKWLYMITKNAADYNGTVPEKFDVVKRSHAVFAEYGNVGTNFAYITQEGFGWMNASYQVGLAELPANLKRSLEQLIKPEDLK